MYYGDKRQSLVVLMKFLQLSGWSIYGHKEDKSDSMTDYFDPEDWRGIAVKNGYVLVVDNYSGGKIGGAFVQRSYDAKATSKIRKLVALRDNHAASEGERANAQRIIDSLGEKAVKEVLVETNLPEISYQKNPGNAKWHIEKDGQIIDKGIGVFSFNSLYYNVSYRDKSEVVYANYDQNDSEVQRRYGIDGWEKYYSYYKEERDADAKLFDKLEKLIAKWNTIATIKLGEGSEGLKKKILQKKNVYYVAVESNTPTQYVAVGDKWRLYSGLEKGAVYMLSEDRKTITKLTRKNKTLASGEWVTTYKPEPNKSTKSKYFFCKEEDFEKGNVVYVQLEEREEITQEVKYVRAA